MGPIALILIFQVAPSIFVIGSGCYMIRHFCLLSNQLPEIPLDGVLTPEECEEE